MIKLANPTSHNHVNVQNHNTGEVCKIDNCGFCRLARGGQDEFVARNGHSPMLEVKSGSEDLMVIMDSFPIGTGGGHVLIVPRRHLMSLSQVSNQTGLAATLAETAEVMQAMFPDHWLFTFEHGPGSLAGEQVRCGGCHVDHAHGHILVLPKSVSFEEIQEAVEDTLENLNWDLAIQTDFGDMPMLDMSDFVREQPYLQIGRVGGDSMSVTYRQEVHNQPIPSQLLRRIVSTVAGKSAPIHWNWKIALQQNLTERLDRYRDDALSFQREFNARAQSNQEVACR